MGAVTDSTNVDALVDGVFMVAILAAIGGTVVIGLVMDWALPALSEWIRKRRAR